MRRRSAQRGVALLVVLWATALLTIMLAAYAVTTRTEGLQARYQFDQTRARYAAEAGIARAVYGLRESDPKQRWIADGRPYTFRFDNAVVRVTLTDESGKVDLNAATPELLTGLFHAAGLDDDKAEALSEAVQDWRDADDATRPHGAERAQYEQAGRDYGPRNGPFVTIEELQMVLGMTPALYQKLAPAITVWSGRNTPNVGSAPALVLQALPGMDADKAGQYIQLRQQRDSAAAPAPTAILGGMTAMGGSNGNTQDIHAEATLPNGARAAVDAVVRFGGMPTGGAPYRILHWRQGDVGQETPGARDASGRGSSSGQNGAGSKDGGGLRLGAS
ncbi:general secretion pathway protein GspK [Oleiagrimonas soli]|uniref:General secretion pathway protein K n=1 Tax=Oleiagrimonas soli TaxID=1543381 RepID=A0A841KQA9_9GAMM|nr:general secretion pathway protein GspK [Oleiagrimonas soli]MBB6184154.1 general secretion pathway protein K [Oleiagrimonas soli]